MNTIVSGRHCSEYQLENLVPLLKIMYYELQGPDLTGKNILLKPNILFDENPQKAVTTHPVFVEAVIRFLQAEGAEKIWVGDAPAIHGQFFKPIKSGIYDVCQKTGAEWAFFAKETIPLSLPSGNVPITAIIREADYVFSLPKLKTHELMGFTGAIKNSFGLIPSLNKAKQHASHRSSKAMAKFLLDLNEAITPDFVFMDGILAMEGPGPGNGYPFHLNLILASSNILALDIIASKIIGYNPLEILTNKEGLERKKWLDSVESIKIQGFDLEGIIRSDFKLIQRISMWKMAFHIVLRRLPFFRRFERRPVFIKCRCIGCKACVNICPVKTLRVSEKDNFHIIIKDRKCIRCFCCHEVCPQNAIEIKKTLF